MDKDGKASGSFLRARVAIEVMKPLRRGVLLKTRKEAEPKWFDIQYEKLPFYCLAFGIMVMGHSELDCDKPVVCSEAGRLPYDIKLRALEVKKKKPQRFAVPAEESIGSGSTRGSRQSKGSASRSEDRRSTEQKGGHVQEGEEVESPLKAPPPGTASAGREATSANRLLFQAQQDNT